MCVRALATKMRVVGQAGDGDPFTSFLAPHTVERALKVLQRLESSFASVVTFADDGAYTESSGGGEPGEDKRTLVDHG